MRTLVICLIGINILTFLIFGIDINLGVPAILIAQAVLAWFLFRHYLPNPIL